MRIVYVGDNRNRDNYGCRATSTALSQLISENHTIVGRIYGHYTNGDVDNVFYYKGLKKQIYIKYPQKKRWWFIRQVLILFFHFLGRRTRNNLPTYDFIEYNWDKSIENLKRCIPSNPQLEECDLGRYDYDALVVNGEGSFIFSNRPWREAMVEAMLMYWAKKQGKKVYFLNAMFSKGADDELNMETVNAVKPVFESIDYIGVRERWSYELGKELFPNCDIHIHPDALFSWHHYINDSFKVENGRYLVGYSGATDDTYTDYDFTKPYICISGSSSRNTQANTEKTIECYMHLIEKVKKEFNYETYIVIPCSGDEFLKEVARRTHTKVIPVDTPILAAAKVLANSQLYITGRYHPAILASLGGTPCVFMGSNSHKNISLQEVLQYEQPHEYSEVPDMDSINRIITESRQLLNDRKDVRNRIYNRTMILSQEAKGLGQVIK